jgi:ketosteroid isomerase-like protein
MSDVEAAKRYFAELNRAFAGDGDIRDIAERFMEPDAVSELGVMEGTVVGPDGMTRYFEGQMAVIQDMRIDPEGFIEIGDRIVMPFRIHGRARETGLPIDFHYTQLFTMRNGRFARARMYASKEKAIAAARLAQ